MAWRVKAPCPMAIGPRLRLAGYSGLPATIQLRTNHGSANAQMPGSAHSVRLLGRRWSCTLFQINNRRKAGAKTSDTNFVPPYRPRQTPVITQSRVLSVSMARMVKYRDSKNIDEHTRSTLAPVA